jgi:hypothetical protein
MLPLDDTLWSKLNPGSYAASYPALLRELAATIAAGDYARDSLGDLVTMCHQWSTYDSTLAAVPHLVEICRQQPPDAFARIDLLAWIGWCAACICLNRQDGPRQLKQWYGESVSVARDLIAKSLPFAQDSEEAKSQCVNCSRRLRHVMASRRWRSFFMSWKLAASSVITAIRSSCRWNHR